MKNYSHPLLADFPVVLRIPVQWGDQDAIGHVNNVIPLRWYESARIAYFETIGIGTGHTGSGSGIILAASQCNYRVQIGYPDSVFVGTRVSRIGNTSLTFETRIVSEVQNLVTVEGDSVVVMFNYDEQRKEPVSDELKAAIEQLQS